MSALHTDIPAQISAKHPGPAAQRTPGIARSHAASVPKNTGDTGSSTCRERACTAEASLSF